MEIYTVWENLMTIFGKLMWFFKEHKRLYMLGLTFLFLTEVSQMVSPALIGRFTDVIVSRQMTMHQLFFYAGSVLLFSVLMYIFRYTWSTHIFQGSALLEKTLRQQLFDHYLKMDTTFYQVDVREI